MGIVEKYIAENRKALHEQLLDSLGLYERKREYAPEHICNPEVARRLGFTGVEEISGVTLFYKTSGEKVYPEITDEEYERLLAIVAQKKAISPEPQKVQLPEPPKRRDYSVSTNSMNGSSFGASFCAVIAWITWIFGLIISIAGAMKAGYVYGGFSWGYFIGAFFVFFILGAGYMFMSEALKNLQTIANAVCGYKVTEVEKEARTDRAKGSYDWSSR